MEIQAEKQGNLCILEVKGRMDIISASEFERACFNLIGQGEKALVVDFSGLDYISSAGLKVLLRVSGKLKALEGSICFCAISAIVKKIFTISGFNSIFTMHDSPESALKGM